MIRRLRILGLALLLLMTLTGCLFRSVDELYTLPKSSETYVKLQASIEKERGEAESITPISGSSTQNVQLVDLDGDGTAEAVAFFRNSGAEFPLKIAIFKQDEDREYVNYCTIESKGSEIASIEYCDLTGGEGLELLVSWQMTSTVHSISAYSIGKGQADELMRSSYTRYVAMDINQDGKQEVLLIQTDSGNPANNKVEQYVSAGNAMELHSSAPLSEGIGALLLWEPGQLRGGEPALMVTSEFGENYRVTDVFRSGESGIKNVTLDEGLRYSATTRRPYTTIVPTDINKDGATEIPLTKAIPNYSQSAADNFWKILWTQYDRNGKGYLQMSTYHNLTGLTGRWYLELPSNWDGKITLSRREHTAIGEQAVVFSYWESDPEIVPKPFLTIYRLTGNNRELHAVQENRFILARDSETVFAAEFTEIDWDHGLDEDSLKLMFHML